MRVLAALLLGATLAAQAPLRVLCITGGGFHDFDKNPELLLDGVGKLVPLEVTRLRLVPDGQKVPEPRPSAVLKEDLRARFDALLVYTQGAILGLDADERDGLLHFVRSGGAFVGLHCAADTMTWNREYVAMIGGRFASHPPFGPVKTRRVLGDHPVLEGIADFEHKDEFYWLADVRLDDKQVLLVGESGDQTRPLAWTKSYGKGRVFYTALGHGPEAHGSPSLHRLVANALRWTTAVPHWRAGADGWCTLFDGRSLTGWTMCGPGKFTVEDGALVTDGGMGLLWFDELAFADFELECEWKLTKESDNAGVFVRFPMPKGPWDAVNHGYEVQICDAGDELHGTGAIYSFAPREKRASKPAGEWNAFRIRAIGQQYEVWLNGERVVGFTGKRSVAGHIGLQNHADAEVVRFRNLRARSIGPR